MLCMAHITLSVPDEIYEKMKEHPEIKWSEVARKSIVEKTKAIEHRMDSASFSLLLPAETRKAIRETSEKDWIAHYKKMKENEWKRTKYSTQM